MNYAPSKDMIFVILALISAFALLAEHPLVAIIFFVLSIVFVYYEHQIYDYVKSA